MGTAHGSRADRDRGDDDLGGRQVHEPGAHADHVGDRVERADLVEVHVERVVAVDRTLGDREPFEDMERQVAHLVVERRLQQQGPDVAPGPVVLRVVDVDVHAGGREAVAGDGLHAQRDRLGGHRVDRVLDQLDRHASADQRAEHHVAAGTGGGIDPEGRHRAALATRAAKTPAP